MTSPTQNSNESSWFNFGTWFNRAPVNLDDITPITPTTNNRDIDARNNSFSSFRSIDDGNLNSPTRISRGAQLSGRGQDEIRDALLGAALSTDSGSASIESGSGLGASSVGTTTGTGVPVDISSASGRTSGRTNGIAIPRTRTISSDSFGDSVLLSGSPGYTSVL